ncbi:MAG: RNA ligase family protein [Bacteroidota bacterium]
MIPSYGKVWALGHHQLDALYSGRGAIIQEKVDGSQFSFALLGGELYAKSRNQPLDLQSYDSKMFAVALAYIKSQAHQLHEGLIYRGELVNRPKHNTLQYGRTPQNNIVLFDVQTLSGRSLDTYIVQREADLIGLEMVPVFDGNVTLPVTLERLDEILEQQSFLGGTTIEGVVIKNRDRVDSFGHLLKGKYVSEAFKEVHQKDWKDRNPGGKDIIGVLVEQLRTEQRWEKSVQRRRDAGELELDPRDIGALLKDMVEDVRQEEYDRIKEVVGAWAWKQIGHQLTRGFAEWYKRGLVDGRWS